MQLQTTAKLITSGKQISSVSNIKSYKIKAEISDKSPLLFYMDEKLFAQVKYSADDYIRVGVFMRKHLFLYKYGFEITFISVFFAVAVVIFVLADDKSAINYLGLISFGVFLAFFAGTLIYLGDKFISPLLSRRYVARLLKSSPLLNQENDICFSNEGI